MPPAKEPPVQPAAVPAEKQGSRWLYGHPTEEAVKEWFDGQKLHEGMVHEPYYGGIVLIGAKEKYNRTYTNASNQWFVREEERTVYTPYVKVDTRVQYFWTLVDIMNIRAMEDLSSERRYYGVIEPVPVKKVVTDPNSAYYNEHLPEGMFFYVATGESNNSVSRYICAQWRVAIYERESYLRMLEWKGRARPGERPPFPCVLQGVGTKQTLMAKKYPDDNAIMKAETGAIGRALGVAGILVVGTGIATAEDIQESIAAAAAPPVVNREGAEVTNLPPIVAPAEAGAGQRIEGPDVAPQQVGPVSVADKSPQDVDEELRERATALSIELKKYPEKWEAYLHWYREERKFPSITELTGPALRGAVVKLERALDEAKTETPDTPPDADAAAPPAQ